MEMSVLLKGQGYGHQAPHI